MNTRIRLTLSAVLGLALATSCIASAHAQNGTRARDMRSGMSGSGDNGSSTYAGYRDGRYMMDETDWTMNDEMMTDPAPIGYPFAGPGTLHLYHFTDYTGNQLDEGSVSMKRMDNMMARDQAMIHDNRMPYGGHYLTDENGLLVSEEEMTEPAPVGYPFAGPGTLHLYHYTDYGMDGIAEESVTMKKMDREQETAMRMRDRMQYHDGRYMMDENGMMISEEDMKEPAPIGYPFAGPGTLHLYHYTDYSGDEIAEQSSTMQKMDNAQRRDRQMRRQRRSGGTGR